MSDEEKLRRRRERQVNILRFKIYSTLSLFQARALGKHMENSSSSTDTSST